MIVRTLGPGDGRLFGQMRLNALRDAPTSFAAVLSDYDGATDEVWETILASRTAFIAMTNDAPVGLASLQRNSMSRMKHRASVINVFVAPEMRGRGAAHALMDHLEDFARRDGILQLELAVNAENVTAQRFYERRGFQRIGLIPRGFRHGDRFYDEFLMCRSLDREG